MATFTFDLLNSFNADVNMLDELGNTCLHICTFVGTGEGEWARYQSYTPPSALVGSAS